MSGGQPPWARPWQQNNVAAGQAFAYMYDQQAYSSGYFATMQYPNQQAYAQQPNQWPPAPGAMQTGLSPAQRARPLASQAMMREETKTAPVSQSPARSTAATAAGSVSPSHAGLPCIVCACLTPPDGDGCRQFRQRARHHAWSSSDSCLRRRR